MIGLRAVQYGAAAALFGLPAFLIYSAGAMAELEFGWPRRALAWAASVMLVAALAGLAVQTAVMAGSLAEGLKPASLGFVIAGTGLGRAYVVRAAAAGVMLAAVLTLRPGPRLWRTAALLGTVICATFAWTGHGAATEGAWGWPHLLADILHALAACLWIGALGAFLALALSRAKRAGAHDRGLAAALARFARIGALAVGVLVITGLMNSAFLVGWRNMPVLASTAYGELLIIKLVLFAAMLGLAAANRFRLAPSFGRSGERRAVRFSLAAELALGLLILCVVAIMGTLPPPVAG